MRRSCAKRWRPESSTTTSLQSAMRRTRSCRAAIRRAWTSGSDPRWTARADRQEDQDQARAHRSLRDDNAPLRRLRDREAGLGARGRDGPRPDVSGGHDAPRVLQRHVAGLAGEGARCSRRSRDDEPADHPPRRPQLPSGRDHHADACGPARRRVPGCVAAGAPGRRRAHVLPTATTCASSAALSTAASKTVSGRSQRGSSASGPATASTAFGLRTTPASGRGCASRS
jgi:hypothetical protein